MVAMRGSRAADGQGLQPGRTSPVPHVSRNPAQVPLVEASMATLGLIVPLLGLVAGQAILVLTNQGTLPPLVAAFRPQVPVLVFCESAKLARQLQLHRAIHPVVSQVASVSYDKMAPHAVEQAVQLGLLQKGDSVVIVSIAGDEHATADMKIWTV